MYTEGMAKETRPQTYRVSEEVDAELRRRAKNAGGIDNALRSVLSLSTKVDVSVDVNVDRPRGTVTRLDPVPDFVRNGLMLEESIGVEPVDRRPKNAFCKHCGSRFAGVKYATICPGCKSSGHTLTPGECPVCGEGKGI